MVIRSSHLEAHSNQGKESSAYRYDGGFPYSPLSWMLIQFMANASSCCSRRNAILTSMPSVQSLMKFRKYQTHSSVTGGSWMATPRFIKWLTVACSHTRGMLDIICIVHDCVLRRTPMACLLTSSDQICSVRRGRSTWRL